MQEKYRIYVDAEANCDNIIQFGKFRITLLTDRLVRLEYCCTEQYTDLPTQIVWNRAFPKVSCRICRKHNQLEIKTENMMICGQNCGEAQTDVEIIQGGCVWRIGETAETWKGTVKTLDGVDGEISLGDGILGKRGIAVLDDSESYLIAENGELQKRDAEEKDIYIFAYGLQYRQCLKDYFVLTGSAPLLPRFALGNWWSRYHCYNEQEYLDLMDCFAENNIPLSVAVIDMDWHLTDIDAKYGSGWTGYTWNRELFPNPEHFLQQLHNRSLKTSLNVHPAEGVRAYEEPYQKIAEAVSELLYIDREKGEPVAFNVTNPVFLEAYFTYLHKPNEEKGVDFWWIDWQQGETSDLPGLDPLWVLNHYHYLDNQKDSKRSIILSRYAGPGSHRYPIGFSGDTVISWESLAFQPYFTATASNIGYGWWSHDIGGHMMGIYDEELQIRWMQWGVFSPINRMHSSCSEFNHKEPWNYTQETCRIIGAYLRLRHQLVPYLYTMNWLMHIEGELLIQPMYYRNPENKCAYEVPNEYYFGTEMICLPITAQIIKCLNMAKVNGWLPQGIYIDWQRGTIYHGNRELTFYRYLDEIPVLLKAGAIVVCAAEIDNNGTDNPEFFEITVAAGANGRFTLYEDDGESLAYQYGKYVCTNFILDYQKQGKFVIEACRDDFHLIPPTRRYRVRFIGFQKPDSIIARVDGKESKLQMESGKNKNEFMVCVQGNVEQKIEIQFLDGMKIKHNNIQQLCFEVLDRAWIPYEQKENIYGKLKAGYHLEELNEVIADKELYGALAEAVYAEGDAKWRTG